VAEELATFTSQARRVGRNLRLLLTDIQEHRGIERFNELLFYVTLSINGFDEVGHYLRNALLVTVCSGYTATPTVGCSANFTGEAESASASATSSASTRTVARRLINLIAGPDRARQSRKRRAGSAKRARARVGTERSTGSERASSDRQEKPAAPSPSAPPPRRPPSIQSGPRDSNDPLLDYLLGEGG
jgi:hypothetical protein